MLARVSGLVKLREWLVRMGLEAGGGGVDCCWASLALPERMEFERECAAGIMRDWLIS
jgi:hypothetical protein